MCPPCWAEESSSAEERAAEAAETLESHHFFEFYENKVVELQKKAGDENCAPISGNLYMYRALMFFGDSSGLFQAKAGPVMRGGLIVIVIVQLCGPLCILFWVLHRIEIGPNGHIFGVHELMNYQTGSDTHGLSYIGQRFLGVLFLLLFSLNGLYVIKKDRAETEKVVNMCKIFKRAATVRGYQKPQERWLFAGAIINSGCLIMCCCCMVFLFIIVEDGPKDVLFDAFGLTFLYNLDDIGGDLAFLDGKWDEDQMGDIYGMMADEMGIMEEASSHREHNFTADNIYQVVEWIMRLLVILLPLMFLFIEMRPKEDGSSRRLTGDLEARVADLEALVATLRRP
mmetsp:Transcript_85212/g.275914  ORF Transcript_85212/g.275914 Transcript_85212/m.275914 type:complete len:341 (+) Transcript_85212:686-1708(+)